MMPTRQLATTLGITVTTLNAHECEIELPTRALHQPHGILHGGINGVVIEHAGSLLAGEHAPAGKNAVGTELSVSHHRPNTSELVRARATIINAGRSSFTALVKVTDASGTLTASGRLTCVYITP